MIRNYLLITFRNFKRNRNYTLINVLGLSIGVTSCIILFLLIRFDTSVDKFHSQFHRLYRVVRHETSASGLSQEAITPYPFANAFRQDFSDVPKVTQFHHHLEAFVTVGTQKHEVKSVVFADTSFFSVFDFGIRSGNPSRELAEPNKVFLTNLLATRLGVKEGDKIKVDNKLDLEVVGLLDDVPANSHIQYSMVISMPSFTIDFFGWPVDRWGLNSSGYSYVVLPPSVTEAQIEARFPEFVNKYYPGEEAARITYLLQPLSEIHFDTAYSSTPGDLENINDTYLVVLAILGLFILLIACVNFINLATALAIRKSKEIGIRKTLGAKRSQLTFYFLSETLILTLISVLISLGLVEWILPWLSDFIEKDIQLNLFDPSIAIFLVVLIVTATFVSGFYPAIILSGFDPVAVLKNKINAKGSSGAWVRRMLVVFQFVIAQIMIIATLVVTDQMNFLNSKSLGFKSDAVLNVPLPENKEEILANFRTRLESNPGIKSVTFAVGAPTADSNIGTGFFLQEQDPSEVHPVRVKTVDIHYKETYELQLKAGRWFTESEAKVAVDTTVDKNERHTVVINETAAAKLGFVNVEDALGKRVHLGINDITPRIVGIIADFHQSSLREPIDPVVMIIFPDLYYDAGIAIKKENIPQTIEYIKKTWTELFPDYYFNYQFLDDHLHSLYESEQRQLILFRIFSGISIFIGCLGLLGLVSFMATQKLKEIGVRKVFGASVIGILGIFSREFVRLVLIAFAIAAPISWFVMTKWLQNFEFHIAIHWSVYLVGLLITVLIALSTVAYRSVRAGLANPIESLRAE